MYKLIVLLFLFIGSVSYGQNRFHLEFTRADSAFMNQVDSTLLNMSLKVVDTDTVKINISKSYIKLIYWKGYTDCAIQYNETNKIDYHHLIDQLIILNKQLKLLNE